MDRRNKFLTAFTTVQFMGGVKPPGFLNLFKICSWTAGALSWLRSAGVGAGAGAEMREAGADRAGGMSGAGAGAGAGGRGGEKSEAGARAATGEEGRGARVAATVTKLHFQEPSARKYHLKG